MGHKGVSKRKPSQSKSMVQTNDTASGSVSSVVQASENQPSKFLDTSKAAPSNKSAGKSSSDWNKKSKKG